MYALSHNVKLSCWQDTNGFAMLYLGTMFTVFLFINDNKFIWTALIRSWVTISFLKFSFSGWNVFSPMECAHDAFGSSSSVVCPKFLWWSPDNVVMEICYSKCWCGLGGLLCRSRKVTALASSGHLHRSHIVMISESLLSVPLCPRVWLFHLLSHLSPSLLHLYMFQFTDSRQMVEHSLWPLNQVWSGAVRHARWIPIGTWLTVVVAFLVLKEWKQKDNTNKKQGAFSCSKSVQTHIRLSFSDVNLSF